MQAWFAVATKPRSEAIAHEHLTRQGYECLLPRLRRVMRSVGGLKHRVECLFPNYIFLQADTDHTSLAPVRSTRGALGLVRFGGVPAAIPNAVIDNIRRRIDAQDGFVRLDAPDLRPGEKVRLTDGPFSGLDGVFVLQEGMARVRVLLEFLGTHREVVLPRCQLAVRL
ncbi:MAG: transcription termination/antitermination NusG family protein [Pseudomarimonas sp.]